MRTFPKQLKGVIFDCDGVMIDSRAANTHFYNMILKCFALPPMTAEQEAYTCMATARQSLEYIVPPELHDKIEEVCRKTVIYRRDVLPLLQLMPGFVKFSRNMFQNDIRLGVNTNRECNGMQAIIEKFNLSALIDICVTASDVEPKPSGDGLRKILDSWKIEKESVIYVGDSLLDQLAAQDADVYFVSFGNKEIPSDFCITSYDELNKIISDT